MSTNIRLTPALKAHAIDKFGVDAKADDAAFTKAILAKFLKGKIKKVDLDKLMKKSTPKPGKAAPTKTKSGDVVTKEMLGESLNKHLAEMGIERKTETPAGLFIKNDKAQIRVMEAADRYPTTTKSAVVPEYPGVGGSGKQWANSKNWNAGQQVHHPIDQRALDMPSQRDYAIIGAWIKKVMSDGYGKNDVPAFLRYNKHDRELLQYAAATMKWGGSIVARSLQDENADVHNRMLTHMETKSILDDTISGGIEIAPIVFDDALILYPLLYGQLFPNVNLINVSRGRRVKGGSMLNPQLVSGISEGTSIQPFNTAGFIAAFDTPIQAIVGAVEIGLDFEEDTPVALGAFITQQWGLVLLAQLDMMIAIGDGVTQALGIFNAIGTNSVMSINGVGGPATIQDVNNLFFGVQKEYREEPNALTCYVMNDTSYRFGRTIQVGPGDQRLVEGLQVGDYNWGGRPVKINNQIPAGYAAYVNLRRYRMYRRLGETFRVTTEGRQLALNNTRLITLRARFGGQPELGGAIALMTNFQNR